MNQSYDVTAAESLIPLLRVMNTELNERAAAIEMLHHEFRLVGKRDDLSKRERRIQEGHLFAEISNHKREMRVTRREFQRLGCSFDEGDPETVHIPGENGEYDAGYTWRVGEGRVQVLQPD